MDHSSKRQQSGKTERQAGREECLEFLRKENPDLSRKMEAWLAARDGKSQQSHRFVSKHRCPTCNTMLSSINDLLSSDILFRIFKYLDCVGIVVLRRTCKQWFSIIDDHQSFWRNLHLKYFPHEWTPSIIDLYNRKSHSSLEEIEITMEVDAEFEDHLIDTLQESKETLQHICFNLQYPSDSRSSRRLLQTHRNLISLRAIENNTLSFVNLKRIRPINEFGSPLKILWTDVEPAFLQMGLPRHQNLVSLHLAKPFSSSELRSLLEGAKLLKHLTVTLLSAEETGDETDPLSFPHLEVFEFCHSETFDEHNRFPNWLTFPTSVKVICHSWKMENLPPSLLELWLFNFRFLDHVVTSQVPELTTLCLVGMEISGSHVGRLTDVLEERKANVEAGLEFGGIKLKMIKTLIIRISHDRREDEILKRLKQCVEEVIEMKANDTKVQVEVEF